MIRKYFLGSLLLLLGLLLVSSVSKARPAPTDAAFAFDDDSSNAKRSKKKKKRKKKKKKKKKNGGVFPKGPREKEFHEKLGENYKTRYTDHFVVLYYGDEEVVKDFMLRIEQTYKSVHRFVDKLGVRIDYPKEKMIVLFCPNYEEYNSRCKQFVGRGAPKEAAGLYWQDPLNFSIFYDMSQNSVMKDFAAKAQRLRDEARKAQGREQKKAKAKEAQWYDNRAKGYQQKNNRSVVQHEVAHQLLYNFDLHRPGARNPQWFTEGLATLFEPPPGRAGAGFNIINQYRLGEIRDVIKQDTVESLRSFVGGGAEHSGMLSSENYARSWALAYYLVKRKHKRLAGYVKTVKKRSRGVEMTEAEAIKDFEKAFGKIDEKFVKQWINYIYKLPYIPDR